MGDIIVNQYNEIVFQNAFQRYTIRLEDVSIATVSYGWRQLNIYTLNPRKKYRLHLENALKFADYINKQVSELQIETL
ncbi:hypothetical protein [Mycoplasma simbae]|uniref:hypothetical protein n=1 Tax=Mycoplasma simbae TaxID=36744 RepID=UPI0012ECB88B|nr:hypothetical protein [Mycoplasma simbae]